MSKKPSFDFRVDFGTYAALYICLKDKERRKKRIKKLQKKIFVCDALLQHQKEIFKKEIKHYGNGIKIPPHMQPMYEEIQKMIAKLERLKEELTLLE
jgi:hypothetical protein